MSKLPLLSWREVVKALEKAGFQVTRQKGSHLILVKDECIIPVPKHEQIKKGTVDGNYSRVRFSKRRIPQTPKIALLIHAFLLYLEPRIMKNRRFNLTTQLKSDG